VKKLFIILFLILCLVGLVGCNSEDEFYGLSVEEVYIYDSTPVEVEKNSTICIEEDTIIHYRVRWEYLIKHVTNYEEIPTVEYLASGYTYYIYLNDELISTNNNDDIISEYEELSYGTVHNFFDSDINFFLSSGDSFSITEEGDYRIEFYFTFLVNGNEGESNACFEFKVIK